LYESIKRNFMLFFFCSSSVFLRFFIISFRYCSLLHLLLLSFTKTFLFLLIFIPFILSITLYFIFMYFIFLLYTFLFRCKIYNSVTKYKQLNVCVTRPKSLKYRRSASRSEFSDYGLFSTAYKNNRNRNNRR